MDIPALRSRFAALFPDASLSHLQIAQAPGRVNLIGEHTDYNDGFVCPMAIDRTTTILFHPRPDGLIRLHSASATQTVEFSIDRPIPKDGPPWALYPKGVAEILRQKKLINRGIDALVDSDIPIGGGLSSSASFEVATAFALLAANSAKLPLVDLALACQWAEHNFPGMPCGIMDQFVCSMGKKGHALLLDCRDRSTRHVPLDDPTLRIVISNTNVKHELVQGEYTARRHQCGAAVNWLKKKNPQVTSLRDATLDMLEDARLGMDPTAFRRARHVISEIHRTTDFAAALETRDYLKCGTLMYGSHESLRQDYAVSCAELDLLVDIARTVPGVYGARMTGGGFGGCIVALCKADAVAPLTTKLATEYPKKAPGKTPTTFATVASAGAHLVK